jgi:hypothetical protein
MIPTRTLLLMFTALAPFLLKAQIVIGVTGGYANPKELNREIYVYNTVNAAGLTKQMDAVHWYRGIVLGFQSKGDLFGDFRYVRRSCTVSSEFDSSGVAMTRQLKVQSNTFNLGVGFRADGWVFGASWDFGGFKGKGRKGAKEGIKDRDWFRLWVHDSSPILRAQTGSTLFVGREFGFIGVRLYAQFQFMKLIFDELDPWMFGTRLNESYWNRDKFNNYGLEVSFLLGKH